MGLTDVALSLLCQSEDNRRAVEATGHLCPGTTTPLTKSKPKADTASLPDDEKYRDPIIRARLGLPTENVTDSKPQPVTTVKDWNSPSKVTKPVQAQMIDAKPIQVQVADGGTTVVASPAVNPPAGDDADAFERKIKKYGWRPVSKQSAGPVKADGLVATVIK
ncbi:CheA signal transduction histidine kinase [Caballeronia humi]|uniref:CheA signal transduction histidine kinase n=2 Tax=Caballeronia humi TaxID=326474 RepID=A0A158J848_9BURK|nr:CheA signal transduction histidine kinase [Caballeronia humi]